MSRADTQRYCSNCKYWHFKFDKRSAAIKPRMGVCRRFPPQADPVKRKTGWVRIEENQWCGEHEYKQARDYRVEDT